MHSTWFGYVCILYHMWSSNTRSYQQKWSGGCVFIPAKPLHNHDIVSVHFNHFYCKEICDKLSRDIAMLTYIYLNVDDCWLTSSMPQQTFKIQIVLNYAVIPENVISERLVVALKAVEVNWFILANLITISIHAWLTKYYRSSGM